MPLPAGSRLGPYEIVAPLGAGGMGVVYRAHDPRLGRDVAIKLLPDIAEGNAPRARLLQEARTAASLNHPHICTVYDVGDTGGIPFIAMELVEGETLREAIARGHFSADRACRIGRQLAEGLEYAHARGVIHRDFKSANIVLTPNEQAKIMDFGIAVRSAMPTDQTRTISKEHAAPHIAGTIGYMAPEVLQGADANVRSDIWSLGVVLYEMVSGRSPFQQATDSDVIAAILRDPPAPLPSGTPAGLARVIERCLSKEPSNRPGHAGEVALALEIAGPRSTTDKVEPTPTSRSVKARWLVVATALVLAVVASRFYILGRPNQGANEILTFSNPTHVTTAAGVEEFAAWSPDGHTIAYAADPTGDAASATWDIWVAQPGGGAPINRTADFTGRDLMPSWSPDGSQIAFWSERDGGGCYVMPALAGGARRVAGASLQDPSPPVWSSDGTRLGCVDGESDNVALQFVSLQTGQATSRIALPRGQPTKTFVTMTRDEHLVALVESTAAFGGDVSRLWVVETSSGAAMPITDGYSKAASPAWSPDGRVLYYVANSGATMDLWAQAVDSHGAPEGRPRAITTGVGIRNAALSVDGRKIAYSQGRKVANVWRVPLRTGAPATWADATQLTFDQAFIECADLNRAGTRLVLSSDRAGSFDLWTMAAAGGELHQLTTDPSAEWCPSWSPDGSTVAFYAYRTGNRDVWTVPAAGGAWRQITDNPGNDMHPGWSSDGKELLFYTRRDGWNGTFAQSIDGSQGRRLLPYFSVRWSPVDRRVAYTTDDNIVTVAADDGRGQPVRLASVKVEGRANFSVGGRINWTPDGSGVVFMGADQPAILGANADGKTPARVLANLSGRRGSLGIYGTPTDGKFIYFTWNEDLGDLWMMTAEDSK